MNTLRSLKSNVKSSCTIPTVPFANRLAILDGYRALGILCVGLYHYFHKWDSVYPYGKAYADIAIFKYGYLGVNLFFITSGFVIALTLTRTTGLLQFFTKRFARLWPPMLLCSIITFLFFKIVEGHRHPDIFSFIPSLTFIEPKFWGMMLRMDSLTWMDGAYWSLWVEVRFYFLAGVIYYLAKHSFLRVWLIFSAFVYTLVLLGYTEGTLLTALGPTILRTVFITRDIAWFTTGICFYYIFARKETVLSNIGILVSLFYLFATFSKHDDESFILRVTFISIIFLLFYLFVYTPKFVKIFGSRFLASIGVASYSLYLLHQDIGISLIMKSAGLMNALGDIFTVFLIFTGLIFISRLIYTYWEIPSKNFILRKLL